MNTCIDCGKQIFKGHGQKRCEECQQKHKKSYDTNYLKKANASKHGLYQYAKFLKTLTLNELQALVAKTKADLKWCKQFSPDWYLIRSKIKAITTEYSSRDDELERIEAYETDTERDEILQNGVDEYENY